MDALFINPSSSLKAYQELAKLYAAIEPPTWALLLAQSCRAKGFEVGILDTDAERLTLEQSVSRVQDTKPRLAVLVVYGQNPNSGTTSMIGALALAKAIKDAELDTTVCLVGSHISALPGEVLSKKCVDIVLLNEGVYALHDLLRSNLKNDLATIKGIGHKERRAGGELVPVLNPAQMIVPQERMDIDLPGYAWDLLPYHKEPLDLYRAHFWHAGFNHEKRTPFAAIYTSLGCVFSCDFCMVNIINRGDNNEHNTSAHFRGMRFWSNRWVMEEMRKLADMGVRTLRISDEMFFLNQNHYQPIIKGLIERDFCFNMWAYSRVDTVKEDVLADFKRAGIHWLAVGVESGSGYVRQEVSKGSFKDLNICRICDVIRSEGINVISNFIFGFPEDTFDTMRQTLDLALELNTEMANMYPCQALPGSPMYLEAKERGWDLPESYEEFAFLAYETKPLPTKYVTSSDVLRFRDQAWQAYFTNPKYLDLVEKKFGVQERKNVEDMTRIKLKRKLLGD